MSITVVGSIAFDAVKTPAGARERMLGGAATHFALAASFFDDVRVVGPVGDDFGPEEFAILRTRGTNTDDVEQVAGGKTFFWKGEYHDNLNSRETLETDLNVFETFEPKLSDASTASDVLFLANIVPDLQLQVRAACDGARFVALDSMDQINIANARCARSSARSTASLNDEESSLTQADRRRRGPRAAVGPSAVVAKQGKRRRPPHQGWRVRPSGFPAGAVADRIGAGDSSPAASSASSPRTCRRGHPRAAHAGDTTAPVASFNVEEFGTDCVTADAGEIAQRVAAAGHDDVLRRAHQPARVREVRPRWGAARP